MGDPPVNVSIQTAQGEVIGCFDALLRNRIIFIGDRIDEGVANKVGLAPLFSPPRQFCKPKTFPQHTHVDDTPYAPCNHSHNPRE